MSTADRSAVEVLYGFDFVSTLIDIIEGIARAKVLKLREMLLTVVEDQRRNGVQSLLTARIEIGRHVVYVLIEVSKIERGAMKEKGWVRF